MKTFGSFLAAGLVLFVAVSARAGNEGAHGGDEVGLQFQRAFETAMKAAEAQTDLLTGEEKAKLTAASGRAKILATDETLLVAADGIQQDSIATNEPATDTIRVNRFRFRQLRDQHVIEALALHEVAGLAGLEDTGKYPISSKYLARFVDTTDFPQVVFAPVCGKVETRALFRTLRMFEVGEMMTRTDVWMKQLALQKTLLRCQSITKSIFCEQALPLAEFVTWGMTEESKVGRRTNDEIDAAQIDEEAIKTQCQ